MSEPTVQEQVYTWEREVGFPRPDWPQLPDEDTQAFRLRLIVEEVNELVEALNDNDLVEAADALGDIIWVVYAAARAFGIDLDAVVREIARSNYTKLEGGTEFREDGKLLKGEAYEPPDLLTVLLNQADWPDKEAEDLKEES